MREKIVAGIFILVITIIPIVTIFQKAFAKEPETVKVTDQGSIAELNREEQLLMQEALKEQAALEEKETEAPTDDAQTTADEKDTEEEDGASSEVTGDTNGEGSTSENQENNSSSEGQGLFDALKASVEDFTGDLALAEEAANINSAITSALADDAYIESDQVLAGKGGWLFYKRADDGTSIQDYQGTSTFSEKTMASIAKSLTETRDAMAKKGARFVVMIVPNKEIIYSEYMPSTVYRTSEITRCDKLYEYLKKNTDLEIVYPKKELFAAKNTCQVYYKYDTHWNYAGVYVGIQCLLRQLHGNYVDISDANIVMEGQNQSGDLARIVGLDSKYNDDYFYNFYASGIDPSQISSESVLLVGDSFGDMMKNMLGYYFPTVNNVGVWTYKMNMLDKYKPDVVVWECAERYADRLSWINLSQKWEENN